MKPFPFFYVLSLFFLTSCQGVLDVEVEPIPPSQDGGGYIILDPCDLEINEGFAGAYYEETRAEEGMPHSWYLVAINNCDQNFQIQTIKVWVGRWGSSIQRDFDRFWLDRGQRKIVIGFMEGQNGELEIASYRYW